MKKAILILMVALTACHKPNPTPAPQTQTPSQPVTHLFELKYYSHSTALIICTYTCPDTVLTDVQYGQLITRSDTTIHQQASTISFRYHAGSPSPYYYTLAVNQNSPNDTASVELWIDHVRVAQDGHFGYANIQYHY